jgi:hypothetical protein
MKNGLKNALKVERALTQKTVLSSNHTDRILADINKVNPEKAMRKIYRKATVAARRFGNTAEQLIEKAAGAID